MTTTEPTSEPPDPPGEQGPPTGPKEPEHLGVRPTWDCLACGLPWPCATARGKLLAEFGRFPSVMTIYLSAQMYDAVGDLISAGQFAPANLFERFLAWTRRPSTDPERPDQPGATDRRKRPPYDPPEGVAA